jgi:hypothetical protein
MEFNEALKASLKLEDDMTEEQAILERSKDRVAEIMGSGDDPTMGLPELGGHTMASLENQARKRRTRSDAGTKRPKPEVEKTAARRSTGFLTIEQVAHLEKLRENWFQAVEANSKAESRMLDAERAYHEYLDELTIK